MLERLTVRQAIPFVFVLLAVSCTPGPASIDDLTANEQVFVEWIPLERVATDRITRIDADGTAHLMAILQHVVDADFGGGEITDVQLRFGGSEVSGILRGHLEESGFALSMLSDQLTWTEWAQIPSLMEGPHVVVPQERADAIVTQIQEWFAAHSPLDVRAERGAASAVIVKRLVLPAGVWYRTTHEPSPSFADDDGATRDGGTLDSSGHDRAAPGIAEPGRVACG